MELGLSLGDASKQNNKRGLCMALGNNSYKLHHQTQTARISSLPCSSHNGSSENGSSWNMGPAAAAKASSANSVGSMELGMYLRNVNQNENDRASDDDENGVNNRKKLRLSKHQSASLEQSYKQNNSTLNPKEKVALAKQLNLRARQVEVWFQNRRARTKLKQTEVDCEYLKRCCETLTEENRRLHKELGELRALKTCPNNPFHVATTLTMCPSCQRVAAAAAPPPPETTTRPTFVAFSQIRPNQPKPTNQSFTNI